MRETRLLNPRYDFRQNFAEPLVGAAADRLAELAADPGFDPDRYLTGDRHGNCIVCGCRYALRRICGYCRTRVRVLRAARAARAATPREDVA